MDSIIEEELLDVARVVEVTSDAVLLCGMDGTVLHTNRQMLQLCMAPRDIIVGSDVQDILYSTSFERAEDHRMPFGCDGDENTCMLKLADGSFIPVHVRALSLGGEGRSRRLIIAIKSLEERYAHDRKTQRLLSELQASNKRLSGTLSVIMSTVGSNDLPALLDTVLNKMAETLDASGTTIYFAESGGFKLRGISKGLEGAYVPEFVPYGAGIATYVLHEQRPCRLTIVPAPACLASFSYQCRQVSSAPKNTMVIAVAAAASAVSSPRNCQKLLTPSPTVQIAPPNKNAFRQSFHSGERGHLRASSCWYLR